MDKDINIVSERHDNPVQPARRKMIITPRISAALDPVNKEQRKPMKITKKINPDE